MELLEREIRLTDDEVSYYIDGDIQTTYGESRRWTRTAYSVVEIEGRYFEINWEQGLTESQESEFEGGVFPEVFETFDDEPELPRFVTSTKQERIARKNREITENFQALHLIANKDVVALEKAILEDLDVTELIGKLKQLDTLMVTSDMKARKKSTLLFLEELQYLHTLSNQ